MGTTLVTCTACGALQPLISAYESAEAKAAWQLALKHHPRLAPLLIRYVDLFARAGKQPRETTVAKILGDLLERINAAQVTRHGITHAAPLQEWEAALAICVQGEDIALPLKNNNYLAGIVWRRTDQAAARGEREKEQQAASGAGRRSGGAFTPAGALATRTPTQTRSGQHGIAATKAALKGEAQ